MSELTWTCHVCGDERPDRNISVHTITKVLEGTEIEFQSNVRYCNDRLECIEGAKDKHVSIGEKKE